MVPYTILLQDRALAWSEGNYSRMEFSSTAHVGGHHINTDRPDLLQIPHSVDGNCKYANSNKCHKDTYCHR